MKMKVSNSCKPKKNWKELLQFLSSFKKCFLKLSLKVLRFLVRLSVSGILFKKVGPIYEKATWPVLVLRNGHFNFWKLYKLKLYFFYILNKYISAIASHRIWENLLKGDKDNTLCFKWLNDNVSLTKNTKDLHGSHS